MHLADLSFTSARDLPAWARYASASLLIGLGIAGTGLLSQQAVYAPALLLIPVIVLLSIAFGRGAGVYASLLSGGEVYRALPQGASPTASVLLFVFAAGTTASIAEVLARRAARSAKAERRKDLLLREASHRIKNNLQTITSLLRIQRRSLKT